MYDTGTALPADTLDPGTTLLCVGPTLAGKETLAMRFLAAGDPDEAAFVVTTHDGAAQTAESYRSVAGDDAPPLSVVDCVARPSASEPVADVDVAEVSSPADLTGIGIALSQLHESPDSDTDARYVVDSLSTLSMYTDFERVYRFLDTFVGRIQQTGGVGLFLLHSDTLDEANYRTLTELFDGVVEVEREDGCRTSRLRWADGSTTAWHRDDATRVTTTDSHGASSATDRVRDVDSLGAIIDGTREPDQTVTLCNAEATDADLDVLRSYFERANVTVRRDELERDAPGDFAVLHRGGDFVAAADRRTLQNAIELTQTAETPFEGQAYPDLLAHVDAAVAATDSTRTREMITYSRQVEMAAWRAGDGTLHAGFQRLSRLDDEFRTRSVYESLAERDVDVHLYGLPDATLDETKWTVHAGDSVELARAWFVVYDGGTTAQPWALLAEEREENRYDGFLTTNAETVATVSRYLRREY